MNISIRVLIGHNNNINIVMHDMHGPKTTAKIKNKKIVLLVNIGNHCLQSLQDKEWFNLIYLRINHTYLHFFKIYGICFNLFYM